MKFVHWIAVAASLALSGSALADDEALAPGAGVILVRQAAHVPKTSFLRRAVELSPLSDAEKSGFYGPLDLLISAQQKLIDDATAHHENSAKDKTSADDVTRADGPRVKDLVDKTDPAKLREGMKAAMFEQELFSGSWPSENKTDPLPEIIKASGADAKTSAAIKRVRDDDAFKAKLALTEDQTRAAIAAIDTQLQPKFWVEERLGVGIRCAAKARLLLTPEQRAKWDAAVQKRAAKGS